MKNSSLKAGTSIYKKISHAERINLVYKHVVHSHTMRELEHMSGMSYCSIRHIILAYKEHGRTNNLYKPPKGSRNDKDDIFP